MTISCRFISIPKESVVLAVSDGRRQLTVTEPIGHVDPDVMSALLNDDPAAVAAFLSSRPLLRSKLDRAAAILGDALTNIGTAGESIDRRTGIVPYLDAVLQDETQRAGDRRTSKVEKYRTAINTFTRFLDDAGLAAETLDNLDEDIVAAFDRWMQQRNILPSTREFYLRRILAIYNRAVRDGLVLDARPFESVLRNISALKKAPADKPRRNPLQPRLLEKLREMDIPRSLHDARGVIMSIYDRGIRFREAVNLRDPQTGSLLYYPHVDRETPHIYSLLNSRFTRQSSLLSTLLDLPPGVLTLTNLRQLTASPHPA